MSLERASWIAGIIGTTFAIVFGIWAYIRPPEPTISSVPNTVDGSQNILIQGNNNRVAPLPSKNKTPDPEEELGKLTTGISKELLQSRFGLPMIDEKIPNMNANNLIFVFPRFYLQAVISTEGKIIFYSVTTKSAEFNPEIPKLGGRLLTTRFSELGEPENIEGYLGSKYYEYTEKIYLGNMGNYRNFYVGLCAAGTYTSWNEFTPVIPERDGEAAVNKFRKTYSPNCYGVGDILGNEDEIFKNIGIGVDFYVARDLPES